jgi:hypothetical protein
MNYLIKDRKSNKSFEDGCAGKAPAHRLKRC